MSGERIVLTLLERLVDRKALPVLELLFSILRKVFKSVRYLVNGAPPLVRAGIYILLFFGCLGAVISLVTAIRKNWGHREKNQQLNLYYNYFFGTRTSVVRAVRSQYFTLLFSNLWNRSCIYYWAHAFGELFVKSRVIGLIASAPYFVLGAVAVAEFFIKIIAGSLIALILIPAEIVVYAVTKALMVVLQPVVLLVSRAQLKSQLCLDCYMEFKKPVFICPKCGTKHEYISPGKYGLFFSRCICGKLLKILPRYQHDYSFACPDCGSPIVANRNRQTFIGLISGRGAWETKFIRDVRTSSEKAFSSMGEKLSFSGPQGLMHMTSLAAAEPSADPLDASTFAICYEHKLRHFSDSLVLFALPAHRILNESFSKSPLLLNKLNGIVFIIDLTKKATGVFAEDQPEREIEGIVSMFIQQFYAMTGQRANRLSPVKLAILVIHDLPPKKEFQYDGESSFCMHMLTQKGYGAAVAHLRSVFKNIRFFSVEKQIHTNTFNYEFISKMIPWFSQGQHNKVLQSFAKQKRGTV